MTSSYQARSWCAQLKGCFEQLLKSSNKEKQCVKTLPLKRVCLGPRKWPDCPNWKALGYQGLAFVTCWCWNVRNRPWEKEWEWNLWRVFTEPCCSNTISGSHMIYVRGLVLCSRTAPKSWFNDIQQQVCLTGHTVTVCRTIFLNIFSLPVYGCRCVHVNTTLHRGRSEVNFRESLLFFYHVDLMVQTPVVELSVKSLYPLSHLLGPKYASLKDLRKTLVLKPIVFLEGL